MKPVIALSTSWCSHRHTDGYEMLREMADLGFDHVELGHAIRISLVPGILKALQEKIILVSSAHNFCPLPGGMMAPSPNLYSPASLSKEERYLWLRHTQNTITFATQFGCKIMVMHCGRVNFFFSDPTNTLAKYCEGKTPQQMKDDAKYKKLLERSLAKIRKKAKKYMGFLKSSLGELLPFAKEKGVLIGLENREGFGELPLDEDMAQLLKDFGEPDCVGYWHDTGHARLKELWGGMEHQQMLLENHSRQLGFHVHDVTAEGKDHQAPGGGVVDWQMVRQFVKSGHVVVFEPSQNLTTEEIISGRDFLHKWLGA